jgi:hypothetical protein
MYESWLRWLLETCEDIDTENKIKELEKKKYELKIEICCLQHESQRMYSLYSQANLAWSKARYNYELNEYRLACLDGRLNVYDPSDVITTKNNEVKTMLSQMSAVDRQRLLAELEGMEE